MRRSYLLLALVAGATAGNVAQPRRSIERDLTIESRNPSEIPQSVEARIISSRQETVELTNRQHKRDDPYDDDFKKHLEDVEDKHKEDEDDDDNNTSSRPPGPPGGTIAGVVIGVVIAILAALALWYFLRIRPRRRQRQLQAAAKEAEIENGYAMTPVSTRSPGGAAASSPSEHIRWAPTPYPERAPSIRTGSSMSGLALPTPALTYSPSVTTTAASPPSPPEPRHPQQQQQQESYIHRDIPSEKPPSYDAITALQSSEPQPEASAYQMGQVPIEQEPPMYHLPSMPQYGPTNGSGEHMPRY
ncbi:hypothetical protein F4781DRAFT_204123 [Annulohypoxylon bovei var. microspora]|nr:hypothetical protein F4781DRAFT_204123 [Annulohypoxylon bovei var. microspora]